MNITDFLTPFTQFFAPNVQIVPTATASATTALQGQFSTVDATTKLATRTTTNTVISAKLRASKMPGSALDLTSPLTILIDAGSGNTVTAPTTASAGTLVSVTGGGTRWAQVVVLPNASGVATITIATSASESTVMLRHRTFATTFAAT